MKRFISLLLVLVICCALLPQNVLSAEPLGCVSQWEEKWKEYYYGEGNLYKTGCGIFALVNAVGYLTGQRMDIPTVAFWAHDIGAFNADGASGTYRARLYPKVESKYGAQYGFSVDCGDSNTGYSGTSSNSRLINHLLNGGVAIGHVPNHFVAIVGYNSTTNEFHVYDSAPSTKRGTEKNGGDNWLSQSALATGDMKLSWFCLLTSTCDHKNDAGKSTFVDNEEACGVCSECGYVYNWESTFNAADAGTYKLLKQDYEPRTEPYTNAEKTGFCIAPNSVKVLGSVTNAYGNKWYMLGSWDDPYFVYHERMEFIKYNLEVTCKNFSPANNAVLEKKAHPVSGTVTSNYSLKSIEAYLDGTKFATWTATNQNTTTVEIRSTAINSNLKFSSLSTGKHTVVLKAYGYGNNTAVQFHTSVFYIECAHSYSSTVTKAATCTTAGVRTYTCTACGDSYTETIAATGNHSYGSWVTVTAATCTANGTQKKTCSVCGAVQTQTIAATGHSYGSWVTVTAATCTTNGTQKKTCSVCGAAQTQTIAATGHSYGSWVTVTAATCTANGTQKKTCSVCGTAQTQTISATGHSYVETDKIGATCTEFEKTRYACLKCQSTYEEYTGSTYAAHNYQDGYCIHCEAADPDYMVPAAIMQIESKTVAKGTEFTVSVVIKDNPGFSYLEMTPVYDSALTLVNVENGDLISDFTAGKQYVWVSDEDTTANGVLLTYTFAVSEDAQPGTYQVSFQVRTCANNNEQAVAVKMEPGKVEVTDILYGDATGDGKIDGFDVIRLKKYLANYDYDTECSTVEINMGADATGDGKIDGFDVIRLKKYLANYDYETGDSTIELGPQ